MKRKLFFILLFILTFYLYGKEVNITMPDFEEYSKETLSKFTLVFSNEGYITEIQKENSSVFETYYAKDFDISDCDVTFDIDFNTNKIIVNNQSNKSILQFTKGVTYYSYLNENNIQWKYDYEFKENFVKIYYSYQMGDINNLNSYDLYAYPIEVSDNLLFSQNHDINKRNFLLIHKVAPNLAEAIMPLFFFKNISDINFWEYYSSSELQEGNITYSAKNLAIINNLPWATTFNENKKPVITIKLQVGQDVKAVIYNGFQDKNRSHLFAQNSRAKSICITYRELEISKTVTLRDTLEPQIIELSDLLQNIGEEATIDIKIESVYPGTKYNDVCIQAIIPTWRN